MQVSAEGVRKPRQSYCVAQRMPQGESQTAWLPASTNIVDQCLDLWKYAHVQCTSWLQSLLLEWLLAALQQAELQPDTLLLREACGIMSGGAGRAC